MRRRELSQPESLVADAPSLAPGDHPARNDLALSDDDCVRKLAMLIEHRDNTSLEDIVALIGRLAVPIELT